VLAELGILAFDFVANLIMKEKKYRISDVRRYFFIEKIGNLMLTSKSIQ